MWALLLPDVWAAAPRFLQVADRDDGPIRSDAISRVTTLLLVMLVIAVIGYRILQNRRTAPTRCPPGMVAVACGTCDSPQHVVATGRVFVCFQCHSVNVTPMAAASSNEPRAQYTVGRVGEDLFSVTEDSRTAGGTDPASGDADAAAQQLNLAACSICMDQTGDMVLLPCAHGGICEACTRQICSLRAAAQAVAGGAPPAGVCPVCRRGIERVIKIYDIASDTGQIKAEEVRIPIANIFRMQ